MAMFARITNDKALTTFQALLVPSQTFSLVQIQEFLTKALECRFVFLDLILDPTQAALVRKPGPPL